jgi:isocitrate dehydrogenase kinase/phosphatase
LLEGFNKHYALFRECARAGKRHFEAGNWLAIQHVARDRIDFYDRRVAETAERIEREYHFAGLDGAGGDALWEQVKLHYIRCLECALFLRLVTLRGAAHRRRRPTQLLSIAAGWRR